MTFFQLITHARQERDGPIQWVTFPLIDCVFAKSCSSLPPSFAISRIVPDNGL